MNEISLGDDVRDVITGFEGVAIARQDGLFEAPSIKVQQRNMNDDNRPMEPLWFEESRLERIRSLGTNKGSDVEARKTQG